MSSYTLTNAAAEDLRNIFKYTRNKFGVLQAESYLIGLEESLKLIAKDPKLAQKVDGLREGFFRFIYQKHSIFFKPRQSDIYVVRVLHQQMKYDLHLTS